MNKIKENNNKTNKKKILISILFLALTLFSILSPLIGSKSDNIKANALSAPANKAIDLNGITYEYQTSLNELKNNYNLFTYWNYYKFFSITNDSEGVTLIDFESEDSGGDIEMTEQEIQDNESIINNSVSFLINNTLLGAKSSYDDTTGNTINTAYYDIENISLTNIDGFKIDFNNLKRIKNIVQPNSFKVGIQYISSESGNNILDNSIFYGYSFSSFENEYLFNIPKYENYLVRNIYCVCNIGEEPNNPNEIYEAVPNGKIGKDFLLEERYITIDNVKFVQNSQTQNIIEYNYSYLYENDNPIYKGNILLSENKYDEVLFSQLASPTYIDPVYQSIGRGFFGGYNEDKPSRNGFYYRPISTIGLGGVGAYFNKEGSFVNYKNESLFYAFDYFGGGKGFEIKYNNQNQLLYLQDITDLRADFDNKSYSGLSAQVEDILYNVSIQNQSQNSLNKDIKDDFINLLKTSALGTFLGLIIGLISGAGPLGAIIGGSIGALVGVIPLIFDALQGLVGSSPALSTIYNLFKSVTMLFVDIFDAIINFALSFITNPIVLIIVVVAVLVYIFVIRKFKK